MSLLQSLDEKLLHPPLISNLHGWRRFCVEFLFFGIKEARSCLFVGLFFFSIFIVPKTGILGIPRYDILLIIAISIQFWMVYTKLETLDELKAVILFHVTGFVPEVFKTSTNIHSWSYPDFAYTKILNVPLFFAVIASLLIYINFFMHHYLGDYRWYIAAAVLGLYARTTVIFTPYDKERKMPLLLAFILIGFFIWLAENISTFFGIWKYPNQITSWSMVHTGKWSSWALLVIMTFTITVFLKHIKKTVYIPK